MMKGIPSELLSQLRKTLVECCPLEEEELHALFATNEKLSFWQVHLPGLAELGRQARVEALINFLMNQANRFGENGLILFLSVLRDEVEDACSYELDRLAMRLEEYISKLDDLPRKFRQFEKQLLFQNLQVTLQQQDKSWYLQVRNISQQTLRKVTVFLHPAPKLWINRSRIRIGTLPSEKASDLVPVKFTMKQSARENEGPDFELGVEVVYLLQDPPQLIRSQKSFVFFV